MWKTPFRPVPSTTFFPQALCIFFHFSTAPFSRPVDFRFSTGCLSTFHRACGIFSGCEKPGIFTGKFLKMPCLPLRGRWPSVSEVGGSAPGSLGHSPSHGQARASPLSEGAKAPPNSIRRNSEALPPLCRGSLFSVPLDSASIYHAQSSHPGGRGVPRPYTEETILPAVPYKLELIFAVISRRLF